MIEFLAIASVVLFFAAAGLYLYNFMSKDKDYPALSRFLLVAAILTNAIYIAVLSCMYNRFPLASLSEALNFMATTLAISYLTIEIITENRNTGFLILILVSLFKLLSVALFKPSQSVNPILADWHFILHVIPSTLGYTALGLSMIYGTLYLALYKELHRKRFGTFYKRLPSLEGMERMTRISVKLGFVLLTIGIFAGIILTKSTFQVFFKLDPKTLIIFAIWLIYLTFLILSGLFSWKGKRYAISSILGFVVILAALVIVKLFLRTFHDFV